jgi:pimeloyl-ACP methyl ester carboxylesterase
MKKRKMPLHIKLMGGLLSLVGSFWPALTSYFAYRIWFRTPRYKESRRERKWQTSARTDNEIIEGKNICFYRWGKTTAGYVLLLHGWSGRATQLGAFIQPVNTQGVDVISFDAPGHGASDGDATTIFEIANVVNETVKKHGVPLAIIAHSFGCMVAALAIRQYQLPVKKLITISCPTDSHYLVAGFAMHFRLNQKVMAQFDHRLMKQFGQDVYEKTSADKNLAGLPVELLAIHDKNDRIVSWQQTEKLVKAIPQAEAYYTRKLGHQRLLRDESLIKKVMDFVFKE